MYDTTVPQFGFKEVGDILELLSRFFVWLGGNAVVGSFVSFLWAVVAIIVATMLYITWLTGREQRTEKVRYYANAAKTKEPEKLTGKHAAAWQEIVKHLKSENDADWKIAILEADSILSQLIEDLGYPGENLGERLKSVPKGEILALDAAWEAHKMRNRIAHEGQSMKLSRRELGDTLANFEQVFREFNYI